MTEHQHEDEVHQHENDVMPPDEAPEPDPHVGAAGSDPRIAAAVARLDTLGDQPPVEHVEVYEEVHRVLQESLADATHSTDSGDERPEDAQP